MTEFLPRVSLTSSLTRHLTLLLLLSSLVFSLDVISPAKYRGHYLSPRLSWVGGKWTTLTGRLVDLNKIPEGQEAEEGDIALAGTKGGVELEDFIIDVWRRNFTALVLRAAFSDQAGYNQYVHRTADKDVSFVTLPVVEIGKADRDYLVSILDEGIQLNITISPDDLSLWEEMYTSPVAYLLQAVILLIGVALIIMSIVKLIMFVKFQGFVLNLSQACFWVELLGNILRVVYSIDPVLIHYWYPVEAVDFLITMSLPFALISTTLIAIYWHEILTQESMCPKVFPSTYKPIFIAIAAIMLVLEIIASILRITTGLGMVFTIISAAAAFVVNLAVTIYFGIIGRTIYITVKGTPLERTTKIVLTSALFHLCIVVILIFIAIPQILWSPWGALLTWFFAYLVLSCLSLTKLLAFIPPKMVNTASQATSPHQS